MLVVARVYSLGAEAIVFVGALAAFLAAALSTHRAIVRVGSFAVLTMLVGTWLFAAAHVWAERGCRTAVFASCDNLDTRSSSWWTAQLGLAIAGAVLVGATVRLLSERPAVGRVTLVASAAVFGVWTWSAHASSAALLGIAGALMALSASRGPDAPPAAPAERPATDEHPAAPPRARAQTPKPPPRSPRVDRDARPAAAQTPQPPGRGHAMALGAACAGVAAPTWVLFTFVTLLGASEDHPAPGALHTALRVSLVGALLLAAGTAAAAGGARRVATALLGTAAVAFVLWVVLVASS